MNDATVPCSDGSSAEGSPEPPSYYPIRSRKDRLGKVASESVTFALDRAEDMEKHPIDELSPSERAGLESVADASKSWTVKQLTSYYLALRAHGKEDCDRIAECVDGKSRADIRRYNNNWMARKRMPMERWLKQFAPGPSAQAGMQAVDAPSPTATKSQASPPLPPNWMAYAATNENCGGGAVGQLFYHNETTGKSQWTVPTHEDPAEPSPSAGPDDDDDDDDDTASTQPAEDEASQELRMPTPERAGIADGAAAEEQPESDGDGVVPETSVVSAAFRGRSSVSPSPAPADQCAVCKETTDLDDVVCDGCDAEYHPHCLTPPVKSVDDLPAGDWFCTKCAVAEAPAKPTRAAPVASFKKPHRKPPPGTAWDSSIGKWTPIKPSNSTPRKPRKSSTAAASKSSKSKTASPTPVDAELTDKLPSSEQPGLERAEPADKAEYSSGESSTDEEVTLYKSVVKDTLKIIAADFEITIEDLVFTNKARYPGLTKKSEIWPGTLLIIPEDQDDAEVPASIAKPAAAQAGTMFTDPPGADALTGVVAFVDVK